MMESNISLKYEIGCGNLLQPIVFFGGMILDREIIKRV